MASNSPEYTKFFISDRSCIIASIKNVFKAGVLTSAAVWFAIFATPVYSSTPAIFACNEFPPFKMENSETGLKGFDVEFLEEIFKRTDVPLKIVYMTWKRALREAREGKVSGVCSCSRTAERDQYLTYSEPLGRASSGLFSLTKKKFPPVNSLDDVGKKSVSVVLGYNLVENLKAAETENIIQVSSEIQGAKMLAYGRVNYFYGYEAPVRFYLRQLEIEDAATYPTTYDELAHSEYFSCFSKKAKGSEKLLEKFNAGLREIKKDGTYDKILSKYR